jgi:hypothetical protein
MKNAIFIRSYAGDMEWLFWCLRALEKFATGFGETVVALPGHDRQAFHDFDFRHTRVVWVDDPPIDGYMAQQITKMEADLFVDADLITHVDSDCFLAMPFDASELMRDNRPIQVFRRWETAGDANCWKPVSDRIFQRSVPFEHMCAHPMVFWRATYRHLRYFFRDVHGCTPAEYVQRQPARQFSEFNCMGAFNHLYLPELYHWIDMQNEFPVYLRKFIVSWSWGGLTDQRRSEFAQALQ